MDINVFEGIFISIGVITLWKVVRLRFRSTSNKLNVWHWFRDNWADYPIHIGITVIFFFFEKDALGVINPLISKLGVSWQIPHPQNKGFIFILIPLVVSIVLYPLLRRFFSKPIQNRVNATVDPTKPGGPKT